MQNATFLIMITAHLLCLREIGLKSGSKPQTVQSHEILTLMVNSTFLLK